MCVCVIVPTAALLSVHFHLAISLSTSPVIWKRLRQRRKYDEMYETIAFFALSICFHLTCDKRSNPPSKVLFRQLKAWDNESWIERKRCVNGLENSLPARSEVRQVRRSNEGGNTHGNRDPFSWARTWTRRRWWGRREPAAALAAPRPSGRSPRWPAVSRCADRFAPPRPPASPSRRASSACTRLVCRHSSANFKLQFENASISGLCLSAESLIVDQILTSSLYISSGFIVRGACPRKFAAARNCANVNAIMTRE